MPTTSRRADADGNRRTVSSPDLPIQLKPTGSVGLRHLLSRRLEQMPQPCELPLQQVSERGAAVRRCPSRCVSPLEEPAGARLRHNCS